MKLIQVADSVYQLRGGSNVGLIVQDGRAVLVDSGLDRDTARKIVRAVEGLNVRLVGVVITHAHADHFGGAATVRARTGAPVYAPALEAAVIANPLLEPLYLFSGAAPPAELRHKFTLAEACPVDGVLGIGDQVLGGVPAKILPAYGHAPGQVMVAGEGVCFVADAVFAPDVLHKHGIPFYVDIDQTAATLAALPSLDGHYAAFVPGHGPAVPAIGPWAAENAARLAAIRAAVAAALAEADDLGCIVQLTAARMGLQISSPAIYWLTQTTVLACLSALQAAGAANVAILDNRLTWKPVVGS
ncbi:MAG: MBL fold metallo-hydrolase [Chloroflexi bacterium HGW-Chloroflexi-1]|nr:MAG: MBL fold metallo-hydrolase [Chloroflexi bacterium HGW-Chloroflexi-1]